MVIRGGLVLGASRSCSITKTCETKEISSPSAGTSRKYIAGRTEWSISVEGLLANTEYINELDNVGQTFVVQVGFANGSQKRGNAIMTSCVGTGTVRECATYSCTFQGTGDLETVI